MSKKAKKSVVKTEIVKEEKAPVQQPVVEGEAKTVEISETFKANLKKSEEFQLLKKELRVKMKETKKKEDKIKLEAKLKQTLLDEKAWLKSIAILLVEEKKDIFHYKVIKRGENAIIMEVTSMGYYGKEMKIRGYDVIRRIIRNPQMYMGKPYDAAELFPGDNSFAYWAYRSIPLEESFAKAEKMFNELESETVEAIAEEVK